MRILIYSQYFKPETNAAANKTSDIASFLAKENQVEVMTGFPNHPLGKMIGNYKIKWLMLEKNDNLKIWRNFLIIPKKANLKIWRYLNYFSFAFSSFINLLFMKKPDVLIVSSPPISILILAFIYTKLFKIKLVVDLRDLWPEAAISLNFVKRNIFINILEKLVNSSYHYASKIFINTLAFKDILINKYLIRDNKIIYIPNGFDIENNLNIKNQLKRNDFNFKVFYSGLFGFAQNVNLIIETAKLCEDIQFFLIGDGPLKKQLVDKVNSLNISNVRIFDYQKKEDLFCLINECDLGLITYEINDTFRKNIPSKIFDYMFLNKPVLINLEGEASRLIKDGDFGFVIETNDPKVLSEKLNNIKDNDKLVEKGNNGFKYLQKNFDKKFLLDQLLKEIQNI